MSCTCGTYTDKKEANVSVTDTAKKRTDQILFPYSHP